MYKNSTMNKTLALIRQISRQPGILQLKHTFRTIQSWFNYTDFQRIKSLSKSLPLEHLLISQPKFQYKYLSNYAAANLPRAIRLLAIYNHYRFLADKVGQFFFTALANKPIIWEEQRDEDVFAITLGYPRLAGFEGELSLSLRLNSTFVQMATVVIVPGRVVGVASEQVLFITQVQGAKDVALMRYATKVLHDITPAVLLINATYGMAAALGISCAVGISTERQLGAGAKQYFDYNIFWEQFAGEPLASNLYWLPMPTPEKPLEQVKSNHRSRTLRKRQFKQAVREQVERSFQHTFLKSRQPQFNHSEG
jgi:uncharacterized protein VirK/YbjX